MHPMHRAVGIVLIMVGGVWFLQGIGVAKGSVMTGSSLWAFLGAACFIAGVIVLRRALAAARSAIAQRDADQRGIERPEVGPREPDQ